MQQRRRHRSTSLGESVGNEECTEHISPPDYLPPDYLPHSIPYHGMAIVKRWEGWLGVICCASTSHSGRVRTGDTLDRKILLPDWLQDQLLCCLRQRKLLPIVSCRLRVVYSGCAARSSGTGFILPGSGSGPGQCAPLIHVACVRCWVTHRSKLGVERYSRYAWI